MKKQVLTVAMLMMSMSYAVSGSFNVEEDTLKLSSKAKVIATDKSSVYNFFYDSNRKGNVQIHIYDPLGSKVYASSERKEATLKKSFNLSNLPYGTYRVEVIENGVRTVETIKHVERPTDLKVSVAKADSNGKYNLNVFRDEKKPVFINIYDDREKIIYRDEIDIDKNFSRTYDLSKITSSAVTFEVYCGGSKFFTKVQ